MALIGYARVSTQDQTPALQHDALATAVCTRVFEDEASGAPSVMSFLSSMLFLRYPEK